MMLHCTSGNNYYFHVFDPLHIQGKKGPDGPEGPEGDNGPPGPDGDKVSAYTCMYIILFLSNFTSAILRTFFLFLLQGPRGFKGPMGMPVRKYLLCRSLLLHLLFSLVYKIIHCLFI